MKVTEEMVRLWSLGGLILGAGGGGSVESGLEKARRARALGEVELKDVSALEDGDLVFTIAGVGSPAAKEAFCPPEDYVLVVEMLSRELGRRPAGLIACEIGAGNSFAPFIAAAALGIPVIDAPANGRAHPLGAMGSLGLSEKPAYQTVQAAAGGDPKGSRRVEMLVRGNVQNTAALVLLGAVRAGGMVTVARNPVSAAHLKGTGAAGAYAYSARIAAAFLDGGTAMEKAQGVARAVGGAVSCAGVIENYALETKNGLDVGRFDVACDRPVRMTFWNEYMALDVDGARHTTFPAFMMTFDARTGMPFTTAEVTEGRGVIVVTAPADRMLLGAGMRERSGYEAVEQALGIPMLPYVRDLIS